MGAVDAGGVAWTDTIAAPVATYTYRVIAFNDAGSSDPSAEQTATIANPVEPPAGVTSVNAVALSARRIEVTWNDVSDNEFGFLIERGAFGVWSNYAVVGPDATSWTETEATPGGLYAYRVLAYNAAGASGWQSSPAVSAGAAPVAAPSTPANFAATGIASDRIRLDWSDRSGDEAGFAIEREVAAGVFALVGTALPGDTTWTDSGLDSATRYTYRARAFNEVGDSEPSGIASGETSAAPAGPPVAPSNLIAGGLSDTQISLSWFDRATDEEAFVVERRPSAGGNFTTVGRPAAGATSWVDGGLPPGTTYVYRVRARNSAGDSDATADAMASTSEAPASSPNPLQWVRATALSSNHVQLAWDDNADNESAFAIRRGADGVWTELATLPVDSSSWLDAGAEPKEALGLGFRRLHMVTAPTCVIPGSAPAMRPRAGRASGRRISEDPVSERGSQKIW